MWLKVRSPRSNSTAVCFGGTSQFDNFSVIPTGSTLESADRDFGTGDTSNLNPTVFYTYQTSGIFPVVLTVTTNFGCSNSDTVMVPVYALPVADFTYSNPCSGQAAQFTNTSNVDSMSALAAYAWNFGDFGSPSTLYASKSNACLQFYTVLFCIPHCNNECRLRRYGRP